MIEPIMYVGLGFLAASLLALVIIPLVHDRAVRLTLRRINAAIPLSIEEIQAEQDQLRAEFAMSTRRLETNVEELRAQTASQRAELGKNTSPQCRAGRKGRRDLCPRGTRPSVAKPAARRRTAFDKERSPGGPHTG